ncbi:hypothetical protein AB0M39_12945 [Streptomyces sp. NPDC051907]|uniref:hypothetical protein n=1 Tax=Streptomyces sp. NPDC051907 TaxID=3155284 RepID=UPI0034291F66
MDSIESGDGAARVPVPAAELLDGAEPVEPVESGVPMEPAEAVGAAEPAGRAGPAEIAEPMGPEGTTEAAEPAVPAVPAEPALPAEPAETVVLAEAEQPVAPVESAQPAPPVEPVQPGEPVAAVTRARKRFLVSRVLAVVLVLGVVGGGLAYTTYAIDGADRTVPTRVWQKPDGKPSEDPAKNADKGRTDTPLSRRLAPVPEGFRLGPDIEAYGNDGELSGKEAAALLKTMGKGLSGKQRREYEKRVEEAGLQGFAMRSYTSDGNDLVVEVYVGRMKDKQAVQSWYASQFDPESTEGLRKGPAIEGHKKAKCFLQPETPELDLDAMRCVAYDGDLIVGLTAYGTAPLDTSAAADLAKEQLDHIASPGEYV